jgi:hypothetical protein
MMDDFSEVFSVIKGRGHALLAIEYRRYE